MLRGVINISLGEAEEAYKSFAQLRANSEPLFSKLDAAQKSSTEDVEIFLSAEEAEMLMDSLPTPNDSEPQLVASLRSKLLGFLKELRLQGEI